jgi:hypothetical protein
MNDQAQNVQIAANASPSDVHSANYIWRRCGKTGGISVSNAEAKKDRQGQAGGKSIFVHWLAWLMLKVRHE